MIKLAITGNIASGKSLVESFFREKGVLTIDTDQIVHKLLAEDKTVINKVNEALGGEVLNINGEIDRKKAANIVFSDKNKLEQLEKILHPEVKKQVYNFFEENKTEKLIAVSVPQLYEAGWDGIFDYVLLVTADDEIRLKRLVQRNNFSEEEAKKRINAQISQEEKIKKADFVIDNSASIEEVQIKIKEVLNKLIC
jgi:dephospho-CoA kinase